MPSFDVAERVELFLKAGKYPPGSSKSSKTVTRAASKNFVYKDDFLWRRYRGRLLKVVRTEEEMREILTRYHDDNHHAGRVRMVKEIMLMYYWVGVTKAAKAWIRKCSVCRAERRPSKPVNQLVLSCLAYGCDATSFSHPELSFHRFPKDEKLRQQWLTLALRDEASLRTNSCLCSQHFEPSCFLQSEDGQLALLPDAVPTIILMEVEGNENNGPSDVDLLHSNTIDDLLSTAAAAAAAAAATVVDSKDPTEPTPVPPDMPSELLDHQYSIPTSDSDHRNPSVLRADIRRNFIIKQNFTTYDHIARYLSHRALPMLDRPSRNAVKRMCKRYTLIDGVLVSTRVNPPVRVPRSREEVNSIFQQFHDNQGHCSQVACQKEIAKHYFWSTMARDLTAWISTCSTCVNRTKRKWLRCSIHTCHNCCGPVERKLGLTFHVFPPHSTYAFDQWLKAVGRPYWYPRLWSSICSKHFTEDCFDRSGETVTLRPDAIPTLLIQSNPATAGPGAFFDKYDAVETYLRTRTYPAGLTFVEKNTFRTFCKKYLIKDDQLHSSVGGRLCLVLRSRQQVETALTDYHNELNHLDVKKCLRLLSERYFWKTMRADVVQWIDNCSKCNEMKPKKREVGETRQRKKNEYGEYDDELDEEEEEDDDGFADGYDGGGLIDGHEERAAENLEKPTPCLLDQDYPKEQTEPGDQEEAAPSEGHHRAHSYAKVPPHLHGATPKKRLKKKPKKLSKYEVLIKSLKDAGSSSAIAAATGLDPVVAESSKPWPVFTIGDSVQGKKATASANRLTVDRRMIQARAVFQQCSQAKVKVMPALDGAAAHWAAIQQGMVVYISFYIGASEDILENMANTLLTTKFIWKPTTKQKVSVLDLPGSVLLLPQETLSGEPTTNRKRMQYKSGCERWRAVQLFSKLVLCCRDLMLKSDACREAGTVVHQGVYGQRQEIVLSSTEPLTHLLEF